MKHYVCQQLQTLTLEESKRSTYSAGNKLPLSAGDAHGCVSPYRAGNMVVCWEDEWVERVMIKLPALFTPQPNGEILAV